MTNNHKHHAPAERTTPNNKTTTHIDSLGFKTITEYNANKRKIKETWYRSDGSPYYIKEFNPITKKRTKYTEYKNGTLYYIAYHHPQSDNFTIPTYYWSDNTLNHIKDYDPISHKNTKNTYYGSGGILACIEDYDPITNKLIKETYYSRSKGSIRRIKDYHPQTGNRTKTTTYNLDDTINYINEYNPQNNHYTKQTSYHPNGSLHYIADFDSLGKYNGTRYPSNISIEEKITAEKTRQLALQEYHSTQNKK